MNQADVRGREYAPIDWKTTPRPTGQVTVRLGMVQMIAFGLLALILGGPLLIVLFSGKFSLQKLVVVAMIGSLLFIVGFLLYRSRRKAARQFDAAGVNRGDGRHFDWNDFRGVIVQTRKRTPSGPAFIWRVELVFADGETAWIIPQQVKNLDEVFAYVNALPRARPLAGGASDVGNPL